MKKIKQLGFPQTEDINQDFQTEGLFLALYYDVHVGIQPFMKGYWIQAIHVDSVIFNEFYVLDTLEKAQKKAIDLACTYIIENKISKRTDEQAFKRANRRK